MLPFVCQSFKQEILFLPFAFLLVLLWCERGRGEVKKDAGDNEEEVHLWSLHYNHTTRRSTAGCSGKIYSINYFLSAAKCTIDSTEILIILLTVQDEKEQLNDFKARLGGLKQRAKTIIQLKPRNPATAIKSKLPIQAVCDFKQMEVGHSCSTAKLTSLLKKKQLPVTSFYLAIVYSIYLFLYLPPDHCAPRRRMRPAKQLAALQVEGAER